MKEIRYIGIDLGTNYLATTYDGDNSKHYTTSILSARSKFKSSTSPSRRSTFTNAIHTQINLVVDDLCNRYQEDTFILEGMPEFHKEPSDFEKVRIEYHILYKQLKERNANLVLVDRTATSITCPHCGFKDAKNRKPTYHIFSCLLCEFKENDDVTAAMNIRLRGMEQIEKMKTSDLNINPNKEEILAVSKVS